MLRRQELTYRLPEPNRSWVLGSLQGNIPEGVVQIFGHFHQEELSLFFFFCRPASEDDREIIEVIVTEILSHTSSNMDIAGGIKTIMFTADDGGKFMINRDFDLLFEALE